MSLTFEDRRMKILNHLEMEGKVQVLHLSELLSVSTETVRRTSIAWRRRASFAKCTEAQSKCAWSLSSRLF